MEGRGTWFPSPDKQEVPGGSKKVPLLVKESRILGNFEITIAWEVSLWSSWGLLSVEYQHGHPGGLLPDLSHGGNSARDQETQATCSAASPGASQTEGRKCRETQTCSVQSMET